MKFYLVVGAVIGVLVLGLSRSRAVRFASRAVSFTGFAIFGLIAVASVVGMFALSAQGGGVLVLLAIPAGFLAWLCWGAFSASREYEELVALPAGEQIDRTNRLLASQIAEHERVIAEATEKLNSFWTTPGKRKRLRDDIRHARVMIAGLSKMRPAVNDPANY